MSFSQGSFIYSAKPRPADARRFELMDVSEDQVIRAREYEDLIQMFRRPSVRNPDDERKILFRVFSRDQATVIAEHYAETCTRSSFGTLTLACRVRAVGKPVGRRCMGGR
jgi:hypothetical protein